MTTDRGYFLIFANAHSSFFFPPSLCSGGSTLFQAASFALRLRQPFDPNVCPAPPTNSQLATLPTVQSCIDINSIATCIYETRQDTDKIHQKSLPFSKFSSSKSFNIPLFYVYSLPESPVSTSNDPSFVPVHTSIHPSLIFIKSCLELSQIIRDHLSLFPSPSLFPCFQNSRNKSHPSKHHRVRATCHSTLIKYTINEKKGVLGLLDARLVHHTRHEGQVAVPLTQFRARTARYATWGHRVEDHAEACLRVAIAHAESRSETSC